MSGVLCALAGAEGPELTSVTFTSNSTWVAPAGTSNVLVLSGKGAPGVSDYPNIFAGQYYGAQTATAQSNAPYAQWSTPYGSYTTGLSQISSRSYPGYGPSTFNYFDLIYVDTSDRWGRINFSPINLSATYITSYSTGGSGSPPTSGNMTYANTNIISGWNITVNTISAGGAGASSTALGQTFPGGAYTGTYPNGTGYPATTTTFTNVAVTPGASYSIVVPSGGEVTLQYYA